MSVFGVATFCLSDIYLTFMFEIINFPMMSPKQVRNTFFWMSVLLGGVFPACSCDKTEDPEIESELGTIIDYDGKAYCFYNNSKQNERRIYGALYTWAAVMNGNPGSDENPSGVQGVCPDGWHVPSDSEWKELEMFLGMTEAAADSVGLRGGNQGSRLASSSSFWMDGYLDSNPDFGISGFNAQPGGGRRPDGTFDHKGHNANFWTSTEYSNTQTWSRHIYSNYSSSHRYKSLKSTGFSVRCMKDR
jgi:uncharacterized protein (TIGR02145 family)